MKLFSKFSLVYGTVCGFFMMVGCNSIPTGVKPVNNFNKEKYLGTWYEIARFDFRFERDLNNTTATYEANNDGTIKVINKGFNTVTKEWKQAIGKAKFIGSDKDAMLKVSFFGPFYAGYNVIAIDSSYQYALISGQTLDYLWILSRQTTMPDSIKQNYLNIANGLGYKTRNLIWVEHNEKPIK